jgi:hypothetical protein
MFVYRVENKDGTGPYDAGAFCPYERCSYKTKSGKYVDRHPSPQEDGIKGRTPDHYYGFQNIMQLDVWFRRLPSGLESLREKFSYRGLSLSASTRVNRKETSRL